MTRFVRAGVAVGFVLALLAAAVVRASDAPSPRRTRSPSVPRHPQGGEPHRPGREPLEGSRPCPMRFLFVASALATFVLIPSANAATYCVGKPACQGIAQPDLAHGHGSQL
jgi:hypothetical protein